jgi:hypothetical protein
MKRRPVVSQFDVARASRPCPVTAKMAVPLQTETLPGRRLTSVPTAHHGKIWLLITHIIRFAGAGLRTAKAHLEMRGLWPKPQFSEDPDA